MARAYAARPLTIGITQVLVIPAGDHGPATTGYSWPDRKPYSWLVE